MVRITSKAGKLIHSGTSKTVYGSLCGRFKDHNRTKYTKLF